MDPLSIVASTIAISTVSGQLLKKLQTFVGARKELLELAEHIERLSTVLEFLEVCITPLSQENDNQLRSLVSAVQSIKSKLNSLNDVYQRCFIDATPSHTGRVKRLSWQKNRRTVVQTLESLEKDHESIQTILSSMTIQKIGAHQKAILEVKGAVSNIESLILSQHTTSSRVHLSENYILAGQHKSMCRPACSCVCHASYRLKSPRFLDPVLGSLTIKQSQHTGRKTTCNELTCKRRAKTPMRISYYFPTWLINMAIISELQTDLLTEQKFGLRVIRIVEDDAEVFSLVKKGDVNGLKSLFELGLAAPNIVNHSWHVPLINGKHVEMCRFLVSQGADPTVENRSNICALDRAWDTRLTLSVPNDTAIALQEIFSLYADSPWIEAQQFSTIHKIALGILGTQLDAQLEMSTVDINRQDSKGRTPLCWSAIRGDVETLKVLLNYGADPSIPNGNGNKALLLACQGPSPQCLVALLQYDVHVNMQNAQGFSALHYAAYYQNDRSYLEPLIERGANINAIDQYGWSPLVSAVEYDHVESANTLLSHGANIEHTDKEGLTPLHHSIRRNSHRVLIALLTGGANQYAVTHNGETILHLAAKSGDFETLDLIVQNISQPVDVEARDLQLLTAMDVMERRLDATVSLLEKLRELIRKVQGLRHGAVIAEEEQEFHTGEDPSLSEIYYDAVESLG